MKTRTILLLGCLSIFTAVDVTAQLRVAVVPFNNITKNSKYDWLGHGFCESLITDLSEDGNLWILDRTEVLDGLRAQGMYVSDVVDFAKAAQLGEQLDVDRVIVGSYKLAPPELSVDAHIINVKTGKEDSKNAYQAEGKFLMNNVFAMYSQIANKAFASFGAKTSKAEEEKGVVNIDAYEPYIKGVVQYAESSTIEDYMKAIEFFEAATKADGNYALAYAGVGKSYAKIARIQGINFKNEEKSVSNQKALEFGRKAVELDKTLASAWVSLSLIYREMKDRDKLMDAARRAIAIRPQQFDAYDILADAFTGSFFKTTANLDSAIYYRKKSVEIEPKFAAGYRGLGTDYLEKKDYTNSEEAFKKAIQLNPKHAGSHDRLGQIYFARGEFENAGHEFQIALKLDPKSAFAHSHLGDVNTILGRYADAVKNYEEALTANPNAAFAHNGVASLYLGAKDPSFRDAAKALKHADEAVKFSKGGNAEFLYTQAEAQHANGNSDQALLTVDAALKLDAENTEYLEASRRFKAKEKNSDYFFLMRRGLMLMRAKQTDAAFTEFEQANKANPKNAFVLIHLAGAYEAKGNRKTAFDFYYQAKLADRENRFRTEINRKLKELEPYK